MPLKALETDSVPKLYQSVNIDGTSWRSAKLTANAVTSGFNLCIYIDGSVRPAELIRKKKR